MDKRSAVIERKTKETDIAIELNLDGSGKSEIRTGIGFFDHMLDGFARHGLFDLTVRVKGDLHVDGHHTVEDTGIVLGREQRTFFLGVRIHRTKLIDHERLAHVSDPFLTEKHRAGGIPLHPPSDIQKQGR